MNLFKKFALAMLVLSMAACADLDELLENPNGVDPSQADAASLYNSVQLAFGQRVAGDQGAYLFTAGLSRMDAETGGFNYDATHGPTEFDGYWDDVYADLFPDIDAYLAIVEPLGLNAEAASAKIMKAYTLFMLVDLFDAVPLSQAGLGGTNNTPVADSGADVYDAAVALLDEAITQLTDADNFASSAFDNFYGGDAGDWLTLANTLKLRAAVTTRLVNGAGGAGAINAIVDGGDFIAANGQNFEYQFGTNRANPNNRHPWYNNSYEEDDGRYQSNWFMWLMAESKGFVDPRTRYYFYRQETNLEPIWSDQDGANAFDCIHTQVPTRDFDLPHYTAINPDMPYCLGSYDLGYFGRDHLNGSGIPPDGQLRTVYGLYPAGGKFDNGARDGDVLNAGTDGALGEGVHPFWQASWTHFLLAEAALTMGTGGDARELLKAGIELSQSRVRSFESLVDGSEIVTTTPSILTVGETFPADSLWTQYVDFVLAEYDAAGSDNDRLGIVSREYLIALWGNGIEGYNLYRRTCLPAQIQPGVDPNFGNFIRSALYPAVHVNLNQNISQKDDITMPVFWDTNDASCNY